MKLQIYFLLLCFCNKENIDLSSAFKNNLLLITQKYPVK